MVLQIIIYTYFLDCIITLLCIICGFGRNLYHSAYRSASESFWSPNEFTHNVPVDTEKKGTLKYIYRILTINIGKYIMILNITIVYFLMEFNMSRAFKAVFILHFCVTWYM